jgi:hypothetical protein
MSWGTDIFLLLNLDETNVEMVEDGEEFFEEIESEALANVNSWLREKGYGPLIDLTGDANRGGKPMLVTVYGGSFKSLYDEDVLKMIREQKWRSPQNTQVLVKPDGEERFRMYTIKNLRSNKKL